MKAFPGNRFEGMELRDYFAAKAMQGILSNSAFETIEAMMNASVVAYMMADSMMEARESDATASS